MAPDTRVHSPALTALRCCAHLRADCVATFGNRAHWQAIKLACRIGKAAGSTEAMNGFLAAAAWMQAGPLCLARLEQQWPH